MIIGNGTMKSVHTDATLGTNFLCICCYCRKLSVIGGQVSLTVSFLEYPWVCLVPNRVPHLRTGKPFGWAICSPNISLLSLGICKSLEVLPVLDCMNGKLLVTNLFAHLINMHSIKPSNEALNAVEFEKYR